MSHRKPVNFPNLVAGELRVGNVPADYGVYGTGTVQKFELGTRYRIGDQVFRYAKAGAALKGGYGAFNYSQFLQIDAGTLGGVAIGDTTVKFTVDVGTTPIARNQLVGGYFCQPDATNPQFRKIIGQKGSGATGAVIKLMLDGPITRTMVTTSFMEILPNPYYDVRHNAGEMGSVMGVPTTVIAASSYGWLQTWGPCWVTPTAVGIGGGVNDRTVIFVGNGAIVQTSDKTWGETDAHQIAGFIIERTQATALWVNPPYIWLTITP